MATLLELAPWVIALVSGIGAILAWIAKLRWSNEYKEAKEAEIRSIERELTATRAINPPMLQQYYESTRAILEEHNRLAQEHSRRVEENNRALETQLQELIHRDALNQWMSTAIGEYHREKVAEYEQFVDELINHLRSAGVDVTEYVERRKPKPIPPPPSWGQNPPV